MVYIWAWQAAPLPPERLISSKITAASRIPKARAPELFGDHAGQVSGVAELLNELLRVRPLPVETPQYSSG